MKTESNQTNSKLTLLHLLIFPSFLILVFTEYWPPWMAIPIVFFSIVYAFSALRKAKSVFLKNPP